jgi:hypothetical protein
MLITRGYRTELDINNRLCTLVAEREQIQSSSRREELEIRQEGLGVGNNTV